MKACLFGHADKIYTEKNRGEIGDYLIKLINEFGVTEFKIGGMGKFDSLCSTILFNLKKDYPFLKIYLVLAYLNNNFDKDYIKRYDSIIYPPIEKVPYKYKIPARSHWMIDESDFILFFIDYSWGGAYSALQYAKKRGKKYLNIGSFQE